MSVRKIIREELKRVFESDYYDRFPDFLDPQFNPQMGSYPPVGMHAYGTMVTEEEEDEEDYEEYKPEIESISYHGLAYHGTNISLDEEDDESLFSEFNSNYSDWSAVWFGNDENVAQKFSDWHERENSIKVVYEVQIDTDKLAYINQDIHSELNDFYGCEDLRECIEHLENLGYDGWQTMGSIDMIKYDDYAIFDLSIVKMLGISIQLSEDEWSDYISIDKAGELIKRAKEKVNKNEKTPNNEGFF